MTKSTWWTYGCALRTLTVISLLGLAALFQFTRIYHKKHANLKDIYSTGDQYRLITSGNVEHQHNSSAVGMNSNSHPVVIFNVLPKSGSRTLKSIVQRLKEKNNVDVKHMMEDYNQTKDDKIAIIQQTLRNSNDTAFIYTHMRYKPFASEKRPLYISIVRDPIERLASLYYFVRYGDKHLDMSPAAIEFRAKMAAQNLSDESFDDCVLDGGKMCRTKGTFVRHFCGYINCDGKSSQARVQKAIANIETYHVIGIMEDYLSVLKVLEKKIPEIFRGAVALYEHEREEIVGDIQTKNKSKVSSKVRNILKRELRQDYELYYLLKRKFRALKKELSIN